MAELILGNKGAYMLIPMGSNVGDVILEDCECKEGANLGRM